VRLNRSPLGVFYRSPLGVFGVGQEDDPLPCTAGGLPSFAWEAYIEQTEPDFDKTGACDGSTRVSSYTHYHPGGYNNPNDQLEWIEFDPGGPSAGKAVGAVVPLCYCSELDALLKYYGIIHTDTNVYWEIDVGFVSGTLLAVTRTSDGVVFEGDWYPPVGYFLYPKTCDPSYPITITLGGTAPGGFPAVPYIWYEVFYNWLPPGKNSAYIGRTDLTKWGGGELVYSNGWEGNWGGHKWITTVDNDVAGGSFQNPKYPKDTIDVVPYTGNTAICYTCFPAYCYGNWKKGKKW